MGVQETYSVSEIKRLCAMSEYLDGDDIPEGDKGVSWDGTIVLYQGKKPKAIVKMSILVDRKASRK